MILRKILLKEERMKLEKLLLLIQIKNKNLIMVLQNLRNGRNKI